jgi:hypothetical protein
MGRTPPMRQSPRVVRVFLCSATLLENAGKRSRTGGPLSLVQRRQQTGAGGRVTHDRRVLVELDDRRRESRRDRTRQHSAQGFATVNPGSDHQQAGVPHADQRPRAHRPRTRVRIDVRLDDEAAWKPGAVYGETDDFSYNIVKDPIHLRDFHATVLHLMGFDHQRFIDNHQGLDQKLTGVLPAKAVEAPPA